MFVLVKVGKAAFIERLVAVVESALIDCIPEMQGGCWSETAGMIDPNHAIAVIIK